MKTLITFFTLFLSSFAFAGERYTCTPAKGNSYFTDNVSLEVLNSSTITVNNVKLEFDDTYRPRTAKNFSRFKGDTEEASGWMDSGLIEILLNSKKNRLMIRIRGEIFISESFNCK